MKTYPVPPVSGGATEHAERVHRERQRVALVPAERQDRAAARGRRVGDGASPPDAAMVDRARRRRDAIAAIIQGWTNRRPNPNPQIRAWRRGDRSRASSAPSPCYLAISSHRPRTQ